MSEHEVLHSDRLALLRQWRRGAAAPPRDTIPPRDHSAAPVLSFSQERMWFVSRLLPDQSYYNETAGTWMRMPLDPAVLRRSFDHLAHRHPVLRSTILTSAGRPRPVVADRLAVDVPTVDLTAVERSRLEDEVRRQLALEVRRPFDLARGPLFRGRHLELGGDEHVVLVSAHHILADGWSFGVLLRELWEHYDALLEGRAPAEPPAVHFLDYAAWERAGNGAAPEDVSYWVGHLAGVPALALPADGVRSSARSYEAATVPVRLAPDLQRALRALARAQGVTLSAVLLAGFAVLLHRLSAQEDLVVGMVVRGRGRPDVAEMVGCFINVLPLRVDTAGRPTFRQVVERTGRVVRDGLAHQAAPLQSVVEGLRPHRDPGRAALIQVSFNVRQDESRQLLDAGRRDLVRVVPRVPPGASEFELALELVDGESGISGYLEYSTALFRPETAAAWAAGLEALLRAAAADPDRPILGLDTIGEEERSRLEAFEGEVAGTGADGPPVTRLFEAQARRTPDAAALRFEGAEWSYGELDSRANRLAHRLRGLDLGPESRVGVCLPRSPDLVAVLLAIMKAGAAYVPLDAGHPAARLAHMVRDSGVRCVIASEPAPWAGECPVLRPDWESAAGDSDADPGWDVDPRHPAYVIYTSGSTGLPKGVVAEHRAVTNAVRWTARRFRFSAATRMLFKTSISFDASGWEMFAPLVSGGTLVVAPSLAEADPVRLCDLIAREGVTSLQVVPSVLRALLPNLAGARCPSLEQVFCGGEALPADLVSSLRQALPEAQLCNLYGPTEATIHCVTWPCPPDVPDQVPIGRPIADVSVRVLDRELRRTPPGVPGELCIAGAGLARGYLGRPGLTAERFVPDPYGEAPGGRMYRTGDMGRFTTDGSIAYLGRLDDQVKVRGSRVEPGEVEASLLQEDGVREAVVVATGPGHDRRLIAYVVPAGAGVTSSALRSSLRRRLPEFMVPSAFVRVPGLPLLPSGKVDRRALPAPEPAADDAVDHVQPATPVERALAAIWAEVLDVPRVGADDDFFERGGHSLLATQVVARVEDRLGIVLPLRELFDTPVLRALARRIEESCWPRTDEPLEPVRRDAELPLSFGQQRLWFLDQLEPGSPLYLVGAAWRLLGELDRDALVASLHDVVERHEILRTTFPSVDGAPRVVVGEDPVVDVEEADLGGDGGGSLDERLQRRLSAELGRPFDLSRGPLLRWRLYRLGAGEHLLLLVIHHVVFDLVSSENVGRDLAELYGARLGGRPAALPPLRVQYADYAVWQRARQRGERLERELAYWRRQLAGCPALEVPTDHPRPAAPDHRGATHRFHVPDVAAALDAVGRRLRVTRFTAVVAAVAVVLGRHAGQTDVVIGTPVAGRLHVDLEPLVGFFVNTLPLRLDLSGDPTFGELLGRVKETVVQAQAHQELPFDRLVDELGGPRTLTRTPLFGVVVNYLELASPLRAAGLELRGEPLTEQLARFDLSLTVVPERGGLTGFLTYRRELFEESTMRRLAEHLGVLLAAAVREPASRISALPMLGDEERRLLLAEWSGDDR